ncbi:hypothetical protein [Desertibacillus haloalkaliphilus]|uniref:UPF0738 family protein n=1 Tax=Desertibacillus haloalkaliphilus TaxID=1328930 RepID=UPI001C266560|nr:hypothetical protein [Desertibacillus haloalkaliphilus]MBU8906905.1 hypothetical protein [Desertibacillus haloalkaliphilus]
MKKIEVKKAETVATTLKLEAQVPLADMQAGEQMLADSDQLAFIYLLEQDNQFVYLSLPKEIWSELQLARQNEATVVLMGTDEKSLELTTFLQELDYLIENIEGNSNYGEEMVASVEEQFLK